MSDTFPPRPLPRDPVSELLAAVGNAGFGDLLMAHIRKAAPIANLGAFFVPDIRRPKPVLTVWAGEMSGYWFNRNASTILSNQALAQDIVRRIRLAKTGGLSIERWRPEADDPRNPIYIRDEVIERLTVSSRTGTSGLLSFYLRGRDSGWFSQAEVANLSATLPLAHELISLRHRILGSPAHHYTPETRVTALRERGAGQFGRLSQREAEVCDMLVKGVTVTGTALALGISDNSVRTLRRRAYAKLGVHSAMQIAALVMNADE